MSATASPPAQTCSMISCCWPRNESKPYTRRSTSAAASSRGEPTRRFYGPPPTQRCNVRTPTGVSWRFDPPTPAAGPLAILQGEPGNPGSTAQLRAYQMAGGRLAWQVGMPTFVQAPAVLVPGGILVQPADLAYACAAAR